MSQPEKRRFPILMVLPLFIAVGLAGLFFGGLFRDNPDELPSTMIGRAAPALTTTPLGDLPPLTGEALQKPEVKLVNFWASWCTPCRAEHPNLSQITALGIPLYGVNYKDNPANARGFLAELGNPYTAIGADVTGRTAIDWGVYGVPETFVIDGSGKIVLRFAGPITQRSLKTDILPAIQDAMNNR